jgi:sortase (surface protein transpeptidase)
MNLRFALFTLLASILILTGCQAGSDTTQTEAPPPTLALEMATATVPAATATAEPEATASPTATELVEATPVPATEIAESATATPETPAATPIPPAMPILLTIPKIEVSASIESVANDANGGMDVPQEVENAAWWNLGPLPGAPGNAVISGHLDTYLQEPAVFWRLRELEPGDTLSVRDARGIDHTFEVVNSEVYAHDQVPLDIIFGDAVRVRPNLILITCEGTWDSGARNYDQRFVVYAKAVE